jgi:DNA-binding response OmpR family regulator
MPLATENHAFARRPAAGRVAVLFHPDRETRERLSAALAAAGFQVLAAADAAEMERRLEFRFAAPEVVIGPFDTAPGAGGGIVGRLRRGALTRDLPVVALASGAPEERRAARDLGLAHFVEPPYAPAALLSAVRQALGESAAPAG